MPEVREQVFDVAQLAHLEMLTPDLEGTRKFFTDFLGLIEMAREDGSIYLRAYEEGYHNSLKLTQSEAAGLGHVGWRARSPQALERRIAAIEAAGLGVGWIDGDVGHGPAYQFRTPDGHPMELFWEVERFQPSPEQATPLLNRPQKRPTIGVPVRRIDHLNLMSSDPTADRAFMESALGFELREQIVAGPRDGEIEMGDWMSISPLVHELAIMRDGSGARGRFHHVAYWYGVREHCNDAAEILREGGFEIEAGPGRHGVSGATFLYVWEPGGNRVELFGDVGYLIQDPDWKPVVWHESDLPWATSVYGPIPMSFFEVGTPEVRGQEDPAPPVDAVEEAAAVKPVGG
jgi:catechol 2,3-dioxygenase